MRQLKITRKITNRESLAVDKYLQDIAKQKLLTVREEVDLARKVKMGDVVALKKLVSSNTLFVVSVAKQYAARLQWQLNEVFFKEGGTDVICLQEVGEAAMQIIVERAKQLGSKSKYPRAHPPP
jgi:hypothetical protein